MGTTNAHRALNQPIALSSHSHVSPFAASLPSSLLSLSRALFPLFFCPISSSPFLGSRAPVSQERIDLWGRFDLPKGPSLNHPDPPIYPSFPPPTRHAHDGHPVCERAPLTHTLSATKFITAKVSFCWLFFFGSARQWCVAA